MPPVTSPQGRVIRGGRAEAGPRPASPRGRGEGKVVRGQAPGGVDSVPLPHGKASAAKLAQAEGNHEYQRGGRTEAMGVFQ